MAKFYFSIVPNDIIDLIHNVKNNIRICTHRQKIDKHKPEGERIIHNTHTHTHTHTHIHANTHAHTMGQETKHVNNFHLSELPLE